MGLAKVTRITHNYLSDDVHRTLPIMWMQFIYALHSPEEGFKELNGDLD